MKPKPTQAEIFEAIDESIKKWQDIVYKREYDPSCPLCDLMTEYDTDCPDCTICIINHSESCKNTYFYHTTIWSPLRGKRKYDNLMLIQLHEIRLAYLRKIISQNR